MKINLLQMKHLLAFTFIIILLSISACKFQKLIKSEDNDLKYNKAVEYYEKQDYARALTLLEDLIYILRGSDKGEKSYYYYAYCHFHQKDYILAGYYFKNFTQQYPRSEYVEEFSFKSAYCSYLESPRYNLDQSSTYEALNAFQLFTNKYPKSIYTDEVNNLIDELRQKLETKAYQNARLYYDLRDYKAATFALQNSLKEFPDTEYREEILYLIVKSHYEYATNSIESKQLERFENMISAYNDFIDEFPDSNYKKELSRIYNDAQKQMTTL